MMPAGSGGPGPGGGGQPPARGMYGGMGPGGMPVTMLPGGGMSMHPLAHPSGFVPGGVPPGASAAAGAVSGGAGVSAPAGVSVSGVMGMGMGMGLGVSRPGHPGLGGPASGPMLASRPVGSAGMPAMSASPATSRLGHPGVSAPLHMSVGGSHVAAAAVGGHPGGRAGEHAFSDRDFPSLGRAPGRAEFAIQDEHFPALSADSAAAAAPATSAASSAAAAPAAVSAAVRGGGSAAAAAAATSDAAAADAMPPAERYGLLGLLNVIRLTDRDVSTLALGTDLTSLGLNLNSPEPLYATFGTPWADNPGTRDPQFTLPSCYSMQPPALKTGHLSKFLVETLFYIFYGMPRDVLQAYAAQELYNRKWVYHTKLKLWFTSNPEVLFAASAPPESYVYFDTTAWERRVFMHSTAGLAAGFLPEEDAKVKFS